MLDIGRQQVILACICLAVLVIITLFSWIVADQGSYDYPQPGGRGVRPWDPTWDPTPSKKNDEGIGDMNCLVGISTLGLGALLGISYFTSLLVNALIGRFDSSPAPVAFSSETIREFHVGMFCVLALIAVAMFRLPWLQILMFRIICFSIAHFIGIMLSIVPVLIAYGPNSSELGALLLPLFGGLLAMGALYVYGPREF